MSRPGAQSHTVQDLGHAPVAVARPVEEQGELDVLRNRQSRDEMEELEHEPHLPPAQLGPVAGRERGQVAAVEHDAPAVGLVEAARQVEQGGLARSAGADESEELARFELEVDLVEGDDLLTPAVEALRHRFKAQQGHLGYPLPKPMEQRETPAR